MKKVFNAIATALLAVVILVAVLLVGVRIFGLTPYTVLSGSMEPNYHVGSLVYVTDVEPSELKVKDTITYVADGGAVVTHRIIEIIPDKNDPTGVSFRTKGDNNNTADMDPVYGSKVLGKVVFTIPLLGYVANFVQNPPGNILAIGICIAVALLSFLPDALDKLSKGDADEEETDVPDKTENNTL